MSSVNQASSRKLDESVVSLDSVAVTYMSGSPWARNPVNAVREVDLTITQGEIVGLVGESGSGKTTLGRVCLGMVKPSRGSVLINGLRFDGHRGRLRGRMQIVGQHPEWSLNPRLPIGLSIVEPMAISGIGTPRERRIRVGEMLELVGLDPEFASRHPHQLSGGQRQRVAIARALITHPDFVVFDEVVSALDVSMQAQILNLIKTIQAERKFAGLFISHELAAVRYVASRIGVMYAGELFELAPSAAFYGNTSHPYSRVLQSSVGSRGSTAFQLHESTQDAPMHGCHLAPRCPMAIDRCNAEKPRLRPVGDELVACHRAEEVEMFAAPHADISSMPNHGMGR